MKIVKNIALAVATGGLLVLGGFAQADEQLATSKGCMACHKIDMKVVGPAYKEVAAKYTAADRDSLVEKVTKGGSGVWGPVPMPPNAHVAKEDIEKIVDWVLSLKEGGDAAPAAEAPAAEAPAAK